MYAIQNRRELRLLARKAKILGAVRCNGAAGSEMIVIPGIGLLAMKNPPFPGNPQGWFVRK
jgi:hypothetical protein